MNRMQSSLFSVLLGLLLAGPASAACGIETVRISHANAEEEAAACRALGQVVSYFERIGARVEPRFHLLFADRLVIPGTDTSVFGYFDTDTREIHMLHFRAPGQAERRPWGLEWSDELAESFLLHEMSHLVAISYMGDNFKQLAPVWHEAIAYHVQLELMPAALKERLLAANAAEARAFEERARVNPFVYESDPHRFALRVHLSVRAWGGDAFLKDLLDAKVPEAARSANPFF